MPDRDPAPSIILITGVMAAGKSTVAQGVAERFDPSVHLRGDVFRKMVVNGRLEMSSAPDPRALEQLRLRYRAAAAVARLYQHAGFTVVYQDTIVGPILTDVVAAFRGLPLSVIVLAPRPDVVEARERQRGKTGYHSFGVNELQRVFEETPPLGVRIDSSDQAVTETVDTVMANLARASIHWQ
jgi:chloramphenicol 3-O-phosphotransferase